MKRKIVNESEEHLFDFSDKYTIPCELCSVTAVEEKEKQHHPKNTNEKHTNFDLLKTSLRKDTEYYSTPNRSSKSVSMKQQSSTPFYGTFTDNEDYSHSTSYSKSILMKHHSSPSSYSYSLEKSKAKMVSPTRTSTFHPSEKFLAFEIESLTENSITSTDHFSNFSQFEDLIEVLTEMGVSNQEFAMKTIIEIDPKDIEVSSLHTYTESTTEINVSPQGFFGKPVVYIVNKTGKKLNKLNQTVLENIISESIGKTIEEVNLEYIDVPNLSEDNFNYSTTKYKNQPSDTLKKFLPISANFSCSKKDFESNKQCICNVDSYVNSLMHKLGKVVINEHDCADFINLQGGIIISSKIKPVIRKKRSLLYLLNSNLNTNFIVTDIENIFNESYELNNTSSEIFAFPDTSVKIPCYNKADSLVEHKGVKYNWILTRYASDNDEVMPGGNDLFTIYKLEVKDAGNYTCTKSLENGIIEKHTHELQIITVPIYKVQMNIHYALIDPCKLSDGDILYSYLPKILDELLCGQFLKICSVNIDRPTCYSSDDGHFLNVTITATMNSVVEILSTNLTSCDVNCELKVYANLVTLIYKNAKILREVNVYSRLGTDVDFLTNVTNKNEDVNALPKLIVTCKGGFGIEKLRQRVCILCPQQTYSGDDEAFCKFCPPGQYQPLPGSTLCLECSSPLDNTNCLRMLYSDAKIFKIYVGVGFGLLLALIVLMCFWKSTGNSRNYKEAEFDNYLQKQRSQRRKQRDIEKGTLKPLLKNDPTQVRRNTPPAVPIPDF